MKIISYIAFMDGDNIEGLAEAEAFESDPHAPIEIALKTMSAAVEAQLESPDECRILFSLEEEKETLH